jgi:hypothetical protein
VLHEQTEESVSQCVAIIAKKVLECGVTLPQACELFVELWVDEQPHATSTCAYYFIDHHSRSLFWLEPTSSELLDMGMLVSDSHMSACSLLVLCSKGWLSFEQILHWRDSTGSM